MAADAAQYVTGEKTKTVEITSEDQLSAALSKKFG